MPAGWMRRVWHVVAILVLNALGHSNGWMLLRKTRHFSRGILSIGLSRPSSTSRYGDEDLEVQSLIRDEFDRQCRGLELIASENFVSPAVQSALSSCFTNKYAEGLPGHRYYGGNDIVDRLERLCQRRALALFNLTNSDWRVNVQPYSGTPANLAVYTALLQPRDRILALHLPSGGHLSHGYRTVSRNVSAASIFFDTFAYELDPLTERLNYSSIREIAVRVRPRLLIAGASAYPRDDWDYAHLRSICEEVGDCLLMADISHIAGLIAKQRAVNPFPHVDIVTTTTHKSLRGPRAAMIFARNTSLASRIHRAVFPGLQGGPHENVIASIAIALHEANSSNFARYIDQVLDNTRLLADHLTSLGYNLVTNGTDNHLLLWNLHNLHDIHSTKLNRGCECSAEQRVNGAHFEHMCELCDVSVNKNTLSTDKSAMHCMGVRIGMLAMTSRGLRALHISTVAQILHRIARLTVQVMESREQIGDSTARSQTLDKAKMREMLEGNTEWCQDWLKLLADVHKLTDSLPMPSTECCR